MKRLLLLALLAFLVAGQAQDRAEVQLQAAIKTEVRDGNLKAAIEQYKKIINTASASRAVKAKALLQLAGCYEKQGNAEARKTLEAILKDYADQAEVVSEARQRLSAAANLAAAHRSNTMSIQRVDIDLSEWSDPGMVSPDGRSVAYVGGDDDLSIFDLVQRTSRTLTHHDPKGREGAYMPRWSPDQSRIAYVWYDSTGGDNLHVIDAVGTNEKTILKDDGGSWNLCGWFPDGKALLVLLKDAGQKSYRLVSISVLDRTIKIIRADVPSATYRLSRDGLYILRLIRLASDQQSVISISPLAGDKEEEIFREKSSITFMGWHPDGKSILITSNRSGSNDLWRMAVISGKPQGQWELIKENIGNVESMGWTKDGALYYWDHRSGDNIALATIDLANGKLASAPERINQGHIGASTSPAWSPDGKCLAYLAARSPSDNPIYKNILCIWAFDDRSLREYVLNTGMRAGFPSIWWSSDSQFVFGSVFGTPTKLIRVNARTGEAVVQNTVDRVHVLGSSGDGNVVYLWRGSQPSDKVYSYTLLAYDLQTGREAELFRTNPTDFRDVSTLWINGSRSPDGKWIAFTEDANGTSAAAPLAKIILVPTLPGAHKEFTLEEHRTAAPTIWAADSKHILYSTYQSESKKRGMSELDIDTGKVRKLDQATQTYLMSLSLNPDGKHIAYVTSGEGGAGMWILENLPPLKTTRK